MKIFRKIIWLLLLFILLLGAFILGYYHAVTKNALLRPEKLLFSEKSVMLYDGNGEEIHGAAFENFKQSTKIEDIPQTVRQAFIDTEDKRFYKHHGFDFKRIVGASLHNLKARSFKEGASTISQQLVKNTHLSQEKTLKRKLQESKLTRILEKKYTKDEILERYLNTIYFGHNCFGITAAANFYFGKMPAELTLSDSAILAGLVKSPNNYSPFRNPEKCQRRKACVLSLMQTNGSIDESQKRAALNEPLPTQRNPSVSHDYAHFVFEELTEIAELHNLTIGGKIEIYTYFVPEIQATLEKIATEITECDKSVFVLDNRTNGFKGCVSSVGNIARLPGSLIKPLLVYAPALEEDVLSPATPILDEKINYNGYSPKNYDGTYHGYVSARECVEKSLNIPAVKVLESVGVSKATAYTRKLGLEIDKEEESLALALGGMKNGFPLKDITAAYSAFANRGNYRNSAFISELKLNGVSVYRHSPKSTKVFSEDSAYLMTDVLKGAAKRGTAKKLRSLPFDVAAKTGTVGTENGNTDAYALSYTTNDSVSVWLGNVNNEKIPYTGGGVPCNILLSVNEFLSAYYQQNGESIPPFTAPKNIAKIQLDKPSYYDRHTMVLADDNAPAEYRFSEVFKKSQIPLRKSDAFSNPSILPPALSVNNNQVEIRFHTDVPSCYSYEIVRVDNGTHTEKTVYQGKPLEIFVDDSLDSGKTYAYYVIPKCNGKEGQKIALPLVSLQAENAELPKDSIIDKEWWEY